MPDLRHHPGGPPRHRASLPLPTLQLAHEGQAHTKAGRYLRLPSIRLGQRLSHALAQIQGIRLHTPST
ncbi:hypothetical protein [Hymenobacter gelipurpurascens]|uniref:hypothetical protein n=1 Tax=Hymenobacter gelipurpurascens TaxID=89968 RepID=UPI00113217D1|nr:hypothetical protein [Hymenobacter gelipurpurascens]